MQQSLNLGELLGRSANVLKENFSLFFVLAFLGEVLFISSEVFSHVLSGTIFDGALFLLSYIVFACSIVVIAFAASKTLKGEKVSLQEALRQSPGTFVRVLLSCSLYLFLSFIGLVLFIVPGLYVGTIFGLSYLPVVLENKGVIEGMTISRNLIKGYFWPMFFVGACWITVSVFSYILVSFAVELKTVLNGLLNIFYLAYVTILEVSIYNRLKEIKTQGIN